MVSRVGDVDPAVGRGRDPARPAQLARTVPGPSPASQEPAPAIEDRHAGRAGLGDQDSAARRNGDCGRLVHGPQRHAGRFRRRGRGAGARRAGGGLSAGRNDGGLRRCRSRRGAESARDTRRGGQNDRDSDDGRSQHGDSLYPTLCGATFSVRMPVAGPARRAPLPARGADPRLPHVSAHYFYAHDFDAVNGPLSSIQT